ncbi:hypothetical protein [Vibrio fluvialis]|uniref:hypothetical protein n=1 Tax=Vibrio fluvialis TaxID=676 RepID=UPI00192AEB84|nr:hypothetical protein [Vibrio fluvialis]MBL4261737.1 hypothetical protein [Vibrio fluvialis]MCG6390271.1 hypothetical protein [Vibrio fluvialis]
MDKRNKNFDPEISFLDLRVVRITIGIMLSASIVMALIIYNQTRLELRFDYEGFNNLLNIFKVPLGFSALIIPIVALLAANHRSEQTKKQIEVTNKQNCFSNYYKHLEEFEKHFQKYESVNRNMTRLDSRHMHGLMFPRALEGDYRVSDNYLNIYDFIYDMLEKISYSYVNETLINHKQLNKEITGYLAQKGFRELNKAYSNSSINNLNHEYNLYLKDNNEDKALVIIFNYNCCITYIELFRWIVTCLNVLCRFDTSFEKYKWTEQLEKTASRDLMDTREYLSDKTSEFEKDIDFISTNFFNSKSLELLKSEIDKILHSSSSDIS